MATRKRKGTQDILAIYYSTMKEAEEDSEDSGIELTSTITSPPQPTSPTTAVSTPTLPARKKNRKEKRACDASSGSESEHESPPATATTKGAPQASSLSPLLPRVPAVTQDVPMAEIEQAAGLGRQFSESTLAQMVAYVWRTRVNSSWMRTEPTGHNCAGSGLHITRSMQAGFNSAAFSGMEADADVAGGFVDAFASQKITAGKANPTRRTTTGGTSCDMLQLKANLYSTDGRGGSLHLCVEGACLMAGRAGHKQWKLLCALDDLYICRATGIPHLCGRNCDRVDTFNEEGVLVCPVTARTVFARETRAAEWYAYGSGGGTGSTSTGSHAGFSQSDRLYNPLNERPQSVRQRNSSSGAGEDARCMEDLLFNPVNLATEAAATQEGSGGRKKKPAASNGWVVDERARGGDCMGAKDYWFREISRKLLNLFSPERMQMEERENAKADAKTREKIRSYIYKRHVEGQPAFDEDVAAIAIMERKDTYRFPHVVMSAKLQRDLAFHFARRCMQLWYVLVTRTKMGKEFREQMNLENFVEPAMVILQSGIYLSEVDSEHSCDIVLSSKHLQHMPVSTSVGSCFLNYGKLEPEKLDERIRSHNNKTCNSIRKLIQTAFLTEVSEGRASPERLKPDDVPYELMENECFQVGRRSKKSSNAPFSLLSSNSSLSASEIASNGSGLLSLYSSDSNVNLDLIALPSFGKLSASPSMTAAANNNNAANSLAFFPSLFAQQTRLHQQLQKSSTSPSMLRNGGVAQNVQSTDVMFTKNSVYDSPLFSLLDNPQLMFVPPVLP